MRNNIGFALPRYAVLALSEPIIGPAANLQEFKNKVNFEGGTPYDPVAAGRFAVLLEPLDVNAIEPRTPVLGCPVQVAVDPDHLYDFAEMELGNTLSLRNAPAGSARVLWLEESGSTERWAVVRLGDAEDVLRFQLLESLSRCGSTLAKPVVFQNGKWCPVEVTLTVHDSIGVVCPDLCRGESTSGAGCDCPSAESDVPTTAYFCNSTCSPDCQTSDRNWLDSVVCYRVDNGQRRRKPDHVHQAIDHRASCSPFRRGHRDGAVLRTGRTARQAGTHHVRLPAVR